MRNMSEITIRIRKGDRPKRGFRKDIGYGMAEYKLTEFDGKEATYRIEDFREY